MVRFESAEKVYSRSAYWQSVVPSVIGFYLVVMGAVFASRSRDLLNPYVMALAAALLVFLLVWQLGNYEQAKLKHELFKEKYGQRYRELVENGKIGLTVSDVTMFRSPGRHEALLAGTP